MGVTAPYCFLLRGSIFFGIGLLGQSYFSRAAIIWECLNAIARRSCGPARKTKHLPARASSRSQQSRATLSRCIQGCILNNASMNRRDLLKAALGSALIPAAAAQEAAKRTNGLPALTIK